MCTLKSNGHSATACYRYKKMFFSIKSNVITAAFKVPTGHDSCGTSLLSFRDLRGCCLGRRKSGKYTNGQLYGAMVERVWQFDWFEPIWNRNHFKKNWQQQAMNEQLLIFRSWAPTWKNLWAAVGNLVSIPLNFSSFLPPKSPIARPLP